MEGPQGACPICGSLIEETVKEKIGDLTDPGGGIVSYTARCTKWYCSWRADRFRRVLGELGQFVERQQQVKQLHEQREQPRPSK